MTRFDGEVVGVSELIERARQSLDREIGKIAVEGEVFEYRGPHSSGHYYFKLRDGESSLDVKMWRGTAARGLRCALEEGRAVLGIGRLDIWPKRGALSFLLDEVHDLGAGDLARRFEELKQRLRREGLFEEARKRAIPRRPQVVGLITAVPSAAAADVEQTWEELGAPFEVRRIPTRVQGAGAELDLARALRQAADEGVDVVLLTRGGGSLEDLWAFNEEALVRAVAACPVPVVCAVGHETDITLADFVADRRCKTPTAGAAFLAEGWLQAMQALVDLGVRLKAAAEDQLLSMREHLASIGGQLPRVQATRATAFRHRLESARLALRGQRPDRRLARARQRLNENELRFDHAWQAQARRQRMAWSGLAQRLTAANPQAGITSWTQRLQGLRARLEAGSPMALLGRGYALVERAEGGGYLRAAHEVEEGDRVRITLAEGRLEAQVTAREHGKSPAGDDSDLRECRDGSA